MASVVQTVDDEVLNWGSGNVNEIKTFQKQISRDISCQHELT